MRFLLLLAAIVACAQSGPTAGTAVSLVTSDIENFWKAYDASEPGNREAAFQKLYLDAGSAGLKDFVKLRIQSAKALAAAVDQRYPRFYATVRPYTLGVEKQRAAILRNLDRFRELYPQAHFPTVYFVIGRLTSGGTTSSNALLIGTEVNSLGPDVDSKEITPSFRKAMGTADRLPLIVIHELTHTQVNIFGKGKVPGLLGACVNEGAADFMTELVTGASINEHVKEWAEPRREELFQRLARDLAEKPADSSKWLYNYGTAGDEPADLGYWIGAEICRSYYARSADKAQAVRDVVTLGNIEEMVRKSQYAWLLGPPK
jgi:Predicted Zn-dependent protease (DUF2268)